MRDSRWFLFAGSAFLVVMGLLGMVSVGFEEELGAMVFAVAVLGLVAGVGSRLIERAAGSRETDYPETRTEAVWGWTKTALMVITVTAAIFAGVSVTHFLPLLVILALMMAGGDVVIGAKAAHADSHRNGERRRAP